MDTTEQLTNTRAGGVIKIEQSLMQRAKNNEFAAIAKMFQQFLPEDETILAAEYLGIQGLWGIGTLSFACITNRRVAAIRTGRFGEVTFQDGCLEYINSGVIYQPSKLWLYVVTALTLGGLIVFLPVITSYYYRIKKCGLVFVIREGVSVYLFTDRDRLNIANRLYRIVMQAREVRVREMGHGA
jgi:hypothetical protein